MKTLVLMSAILFAIPCIGQTKYLYKYDLKLEDAPSSFTVTPDSGTSESSVKVFVTDFLGRQIPFAKIRVLSAGLDKAFITDASGYLFLPTTTSSFKFIISSVSHNDLVIDSFNTPNSTSTILKAKLTLHVSRQRCSVNSVNKLTLKEINEIAKRFSANPFDAKILENKTYAVTCQL